VTSPGFEVRAPERLRFILVVALVNLAFLAVDLSLPHPSVSLVVTGRLLLSTLMGLLVVLNRRIEDPCLFQALVRGVSAGVAASFVLLVWGSGVSAGPYLVFLPLLPIVLGVAVPDDPIAIALAALAGAVGGLACVLGEGVTSAQFVFWVLAFASGGAYGVTGGYLHLRASTQQARSERDREDALERLSRDQDLRVAAEVEREMLTKQLQTLHSFAHDIFILMTPAGHIVQVNDRALQAYGYSEEQILGLDVRDLRDPAFSSDADAQLREADEGGVRFNTRHRRRDGTSFPVQVSSRELRIGAKRFRQSIVRDLTEEHDALAASQQAAAALQASQERLERILESAAEGILVSDPTGQIVFSNGRAAELLDQTQEGLLGQPVLEALPPELREQAFAGIPELVRGERLTGEARLTRPGREDRFLLYAVNQLASPGGVDAGFVCVLVDLTPLRGAQAQLLHSQKMEAVGRLASGIAHDFNNLLVVILSNARFLLDDLKPGSTMAEDASGIAEAGERAARLVKQLLTFSRKSQTQPEAITLEGVVLAMDKLVRRTIGEDIEIEVGLEPGGWYTRIDPGHLEQVLMNLAVNARDAMPGGGRLRIRTGNHLLERPLAPELEGLAPGRYVALEVEDSGTGMDAATQSRIFEPFFTTKGEGKGTGLGLATVYGIAEQAGGRVTVRSALGRGSTFSVWLPVCEAPVFTIKDSDPGDRRGQGETVLVVEDSQLVRTSTRRMLERSGFKALEAVSGEQALALLAAGPIDLVLCDVVMPGPSGEDLAFTLGLSHPGLPVVLMTGYTDRDLSTTWPVLAKPFNEKTLARQLRTALDSRPQRASPPAARPAQSR
jgi:two-component system, cell cycle sensor histidine kinase and response regulator CckA